MTKWARMRRRKERRRVEEASKNSTFVESEAKLAEPEKISDNVKHSQKTQKIGTTKTSNHKILSQIPRYVYLIAFFVLLSGVFFPLITIGADDSYIYVIEGVITLFLGLAGGILLFKSTTSVKNKGILLAIGFGLIAVSLTLIFLIQDWFHQEFIRF